MVTNYSQYDKLKGKEVLGLPICLVLATGLLWGIVKYGNNHNPNHYNPSPEIRAVQSQDPCSKSPKDLSRLVDKYRGEK